MKYETSIWDHNPDKYLKECKKICSLSKRLVEGQISVIDSHEKFIKYQFWFKQKDNSDFTIFHEIAKEIGNLPIGNVRDLWETKALKKADVELKKIEEAFKSLAVKSAKRIYQKYDSILKNKNSI